MTTLKLGVSCCNVIGLTLETNSEKIATIVGTAFAVSTGVTVSILGSTILMNLYRERFRNAVNAGRNDGTEVGDPVRGSLRVKLYFNTAECFLQFFDDYESGKLQDRLKEEFAKIDIFDENLPATFRENLKGKLEGFSIEDELEVKIVNEAEVEGIRSNLKRQMSDSDVSESPDSWKWESNSEVHREKFEKFRQYAKSHPGKIKEVNGVRFCTDPEFSIGIGVDGTCVYIGLSKDGYERAVKRLNKVTCANTGDNEWEISNILSAVDSKFTVRYWSYDDQSDSEFAYLVLDLCEETLEEYVEAKSQDDLTNNAPSILRQILEGLNDLHRKPEPVLHRDVKPSNILRDSNGKWLLADFGLSRTLSEERTTHQSEEKGTRYWQAVESYPPKDGPNNKVVRYKRKSDIQAAGMAGFYILTKGEHPFGSDVHQLVNNLRDDKPINLPKLRDPVAKDLISWMLQHNPEDRPFADQALKHPYLQSIEQQAELLKAVGNQSEIKGSRSISSKVADEINNNPLLSSTDWQGQIPPDVLAYLCFDSKKRKTFTYGPEWTECLRLIRNAAAHWNQRPHPAPTEHNVVEEPGKYFVKLFPCLPVVVHKVIREDPHWKEKGELRGFFEAVGNQ